MKFSDPETAIEFEDITEARFAYCKMKCRECRLSCFRNEDGTRCDIYCHNHPLKAAELMGLRAVTNASRA